MQSTGVSVNHALRAMDGSGLFADPQGSPRIDDREYTEHPRDGWRQRDHRARAEHDECEAGHDEPRFPTKGGRSTTRSAYNPDLESRQHSQRDMLITDEKRSESIEVVVTRIVMHGWTCLSVK